MKSETGRSEMIFSRGLQTVNKVQVKAAYVSVCDTGRNDIPAAVSVLHPSPSRWLLPSHHPSSGECRTVKCERLRGIADLGESRAGSGNTACLRST